MEKRKQVRFGRAIVAAPSTRDEIAADILAYLKQHPAAEDRVEGIANRWLLQPTLGQRVNTVEEALHELEQRLFLDSVDPAPIV